MMGKFTRHLNTIVRVVWWSINTVTGEKHYQNIKGLVVEAGEDYGVVEGSKDGKPFTIDDENVTDIKPTTVVCWPRHKKVKA